MNATRPYVSYGWPKEPGACFEEFLKVLCHPPDEAMNDLELNDRLGEDLMSVLRAEGVFVPAGEADWFPCGEGGGDECPRHVARDSLKGKAKPHLAICRDLSCGMLEVSSEELRTSAMSCDALLRLLQRTMGLREEPRRPDPVVERAWILRTPTPEKGNRAVIALLQPATSELRWLLADMERRHGNPLVLLPMSRWVSPDLAQSYSGGAKLELAFLEHRLRFDDGQLTWSEPEAVEPGTGIGIGAAYAKAFEGGKPRMLTLEQYQREVKRARKVDLFLDIAGPEGRDCRAGRRDTKGSYKPVWIPVTQAHALAKVMIAGRAIRASALRTNQRGDHLRLFGRARQLIDVSLGRYEWLYFHLIAGDTSEDKEVVFRPPVGAKFLLLCPPGFGR